MHLSAVMTDPATATPTPQADTPWYAAVATTLTTAYQQSQINKINLARAQQGLPPLDTAATRVDVGLPADQLNKILWVGGGLIAVVALTILLRRGR